MTGSAKLPDADAISGESLVRSVSDSGPARSRYDDIIDLPRPPLPPKHPPLSTAQRAGQFASFKAISKYHESTEGIEEDADRPETEVIFDDVQPEIADELYLDTLPEGFCIDDAPECSNT